MFRSSDAVVLLDIETAPRRWWVPANECPDRRRELADVRAPANYGPEAAARWLADKGAAAALDAWQSYSVQPHRGQVVTVVASVYGTDRVLAEHEDRAEKVLIAELDAWLAAVKPRTIVAWHGSRFDFGFLAARATMHGTCPKLARMLNPRPIGKPWEAPVQLVDAAKHWPTTDKPPRLRELDDLWMWPEGPDPLEGDGGKVLPALLSGRSDQVLAHCRADVLVRLTGIWTRLRPLWDV